MYDIKKTNYIVLFMFISQLFWGPILYMFPLSTQAMSTLTQLSLFIFPAGLYFILTKESLKDTLSLHSISFKNIIIVVVMAFAIQPTMAFLSLISSFFFPNEVVDMMIEMQKIPFSLMIFTIAVMPSICEEIFFRGITLSGYKNISESKACLMSGFLFGLMHMNGQQFLYAFVLGSIFAFLVRRCGSILISMIGHFVINATQVTGAHFIYSSLNIQNEIPEIPELPFSVEILQIFSVGFMMVISLPFFILALWMFLKNNPKPDFNKNPSNERVFFNIPILIIICFYLWFAIITPLL